MVSAGERSSFTEVGPGTPAADWRDRPEWGTGLPLTLDHVGRLVVVAAHPDDETLGAGGLVATATGLGVPVDIVCATDGEGSHPRSPTITPEQLSVIRAEEGRRAAQALGVTSERVHRLSLPDGGVGAKLALFSDRLDAIVGTGGGVTIVAPWRRDGHPDHEAAGAAAAEAARRTHSELWEYPVWFWHWGTPDQAPWAQLRPFALGDAALEAKRRAIRAHASQVAPLSDQDGDQTLLPPDLLAHFEDGPEHFLVTPAT
jgi:LmbE family N-acetylglucosaminyl deacetylase